MIKTTTYEVLSNELLSEWKNILLFDKSSKEGKNFRNTEFWLDTIENNHKNTFINRRNAYYKLLGENGLQNLIYKDISEKLKTLNNCAFSTSLKSKRLNSLELKTG